MRETYHDELNTVVNDLVAMSERVRGALMAATQALLSADLTVAEQCISDDDEVDAMADDLETRCFSLLARQAPVAGELRIVVAAIRMVGDLSRMGDLAAHIAKIARMRYPEHAVPESLTQNFRRMATVAEEMVTTAGRTLSERDVRDAESLADSDEEMDELRRLHFRVMLDGEWPHSIEAAVDVALLGRYYERIADHAVLMARRVIYIVTGTQPEGEHWTIA
ncbi:phosphate signaling complex protein PhoU [Propionicicella superfundia]|uniref:phosphate signaling complex protein PhoU n=1 Tax=Propionicicella superfundia TaxID=348582 RepID=UPI0003F89D57|nr:phosphate signaling complex protein PhoU [Propionicicella superfundia]